MKLITHYEYVVNKDKSLNAWKSKIVGLIKII